jgi:hypothetical protein
MPSFPSAAIPPPFHRRFIPAVLLLLMVATGLYGEFLALS